MVPVAGAMDAPRVLERRRIIVADPEILGSKQPYHAVAEMPYPASLSEQQVASVIPPRVVTTG